MRIAFLINRRRSACAPRVPAIARARGRAAGAALVCGRWSMVRADARLCLRSERHARPRSDHPQRRTRRKAGLKQGARRTFCRAGCVDMNLALEGGVDAYLAAVAYILNFTRTMRLSEKWGTGPSVRWIVCDISRFFWTCINLPINLVIVTFRFNIA
ncbi:hypothetical protein HYPSUDRAFT_955037 [Hypholoma sublateritium FD-334 SS-4]|uniref:Uncharacterized protein n=1 Tax=Hypholoma sublateritium (strain FD-334 SS-4) TaxID=945553 RepID=A0A0D2NNZ7_HYPSF|nr:hypothetical protein HYPSUDRAFT_955037 [Hypholoma sublateritium FD-334 SS-4]